MKHFTKILLLLTVLALFPGTVCAQQPDSTQKVNKVNYIPQVHGVIRARGEVATENGDIRFQVRNARINVEGKIAPTISYNINTDFCDRGKIKILDAYIDAGIAKGLYVRAGQFRMPFGVDTFRGPNSYFFGNRSFIGKQICNYRAVGAKVTYTIPSIPLTIDAGVFNPATIGDHTGWQKTVTYSAKLSYNIAGFSLCTGYMSIKPDKIRTNMIDGCIGFKNDRLTVEAEYLYKYYENNAHKATHGWLVFANYQMPIKAGIFNYLSFQGRYDGMTANCDSYSDDLETLPTTHQQRNRATIGTTITYKRSKNMFFDIRVNYEKYFYKAGVAHDLDNSDKALVELVLRF